MIHTYNNFKQWFQRTYPNATINAVYGLKAYTFNEAMSPLHMYEYNVQQLPNGQYIVFPGATAEDIADIMSTINREGKIPERPKKAVPGTFSAFERYLVARNIRPIHRTYIANATAADTLFVKTDDPVWNIKRSWYMYEFTIEPTTGLKSLFEERVDKIPHLLTENGTVVMLIKASHSTYVSKKQLFLQKFATMQPIYEQLIAACATEDWVRAQSLCEQYMSIQFGFTGTVDVNKMKEAYANGTLMLYTRTQGNLCPSNSEEM